MDEAKTKQKRRSWLQFSVRALLVAVLITAVFLGVQVNRARAQARAVAEVKAYGGFVHYDYEYVNGAYKPGCEPWAPSWLRAAIGDDFFRTAVEVNLICEGVGPTQVQTARTDDAVMPVLRDLPGLKALSIHEGQATDRSMEVVRHLGSLENLSIPEGPGLTDAGLANLAGLRHLKDLSLGEVKVTDAGLAHLSRLYALKQLYIWPAPGEPELRGITDAGMRHISGLTSLEELTIVNGSFTDECLASVAKLVNLKALRFTFGAFRFSQDGLAVLKPLRNLKELDLQGDGVPGAGLHHLAELPNLTQLFLAMDSPLVQHGNELQEGVERLLRSRPGLIVR
jgi:hypothetical protein